MIEARALVSINFLNLSENYDFMSRWLGVYDKYAKLLKGSSDAVVKDGSGKIPESANDKVDLTNKHLALQAILAEYGQKLNKSHLYSETVGLSEALDMSARIAGYILILQSEKNHDSVERLNLADRITEVEKANNLYLDLDTQRGIVKEQKGLSMRIRKNVK